MAGLSLSRLKARFKKETGVSPANFIMLRRIEGAKELLDRTDKNITDVAFELGFSSSQYFATAFKRYTGMTPKEFRGG